jgi:hypothetical protein
VKIAIASLLFLCSAALAMHLISANGLSLEAYEKALEYYKAHQDLIANKEYMTIIDFTRPSYMKRMYVFNWTTGEIKRYLVAHGQNSGYIYAREFSNEIGSHKSCLGFFITGEQYQGDHGAALRLHGQQEGINDNAFRRDIVIHGADWVSYGAVFENRGRLGRSWGCPAVSMSQVEEVVENLKGGSLLYIYAEQTER